MEAYEGFAKVYDVFMDETPYEEWGKRIRDIITKYGISRPGLSGENKTPIETERDLVLELGCGTGNMTQLLASYGYDMIGVDCSEEMLSAAMEKREKEALPVLYLLQDMRELELYGTVGTVVSVCDSLNYLLTEEDLLQTFSRVNNYLFPGGIFIFDFNTVYKYERVIGDTTIAEDREACSFIWDNYYDPEKQINEYDLTLFVARQDGLYQKFTETHYQRGYTLSAMRNIAEEAGLMWVFSMDGDTGGEVTAETERVLAVVREKNKRENNENR